MFYWDLNKLQEMKDGDVGGGGRGDGTESKCILGLDEDVLFLK